MSFCMEIWTFFTWYKGIRWSPTLVCHLNNISIAPVSTGTHFWNFNVSQLCHQFSWGTISTFSFSLFLFSFPFTCKGVTNIETGKIDLKCTINAWTLTIIVRQHDQGTSTFNKIGFNLQIVHHFELMGFNCKLTAFGTRGQLCYYSPYWLAYQILANVRF